MTSEVDTLHPRGVRSEPGSTQPLADRLRERAGTLSPAEQRVIDHLLSSGPGVVLLSAARIGADLGLSDATVVRTAQALGYRGLADLKQALAEQPPEPTLRDRLRSSLSDAERDSVLLSSVRQQLDALEVLCRRIDEATFARAVDVLAGATGVVWCGMGPSAHLAQYASLLSARVGRRARCFSHAGSDFADELITLRVDEAVVVLAYGRLHRQVKVLLDRCVAQEVPVVMVTDRVTDGQAEGVTVALNAGRGTPGLFASHGATIVLLEALVLGLASRSPGAAEERLDDLNDVRAAIAGRRIDVDPH